MAEMFRERNDSEKNLKEGGFKDIRKWRNTDIKQQLIKQLTEVSHRVVHKERQPYCRCCGMKAISKKIMLIDEKIKDAINSGDKKLRLDIDIDFEEFSNKKNFNLVDTEDVEGPEYKGSNRYVRKGIRKNYECKKCHALFSMEFTLEEIETKESKTEEGKPPKA